LLPESEATTAYLRDQQKLDELNSLLNEIYADKTITTSIFIIKIQTNYQFLDTKSPIPSNDLIKF